MAPDLLLRTFPKGVTYRHIIPPTIKSCTAFYTVSYAKAPFQEPPFPKIICMLTHTSCNNFLSLIAPSCEALIYTEKSRNFCKTEDQYAALLAFRIPLITLWKSLELFSPTSLFELGLESLTYSDRSNGLLPKCLETDISFLTLPQISWLILGYSLKTQLNKGMWSF